MRLEINDAFLRALRPPATGRLEVWDTKQPGLALRVTPTGACTWSVRTRTVEGKRTRPTLGSWPDLSIRQARAAARIRLGEITAGGDPVEEKRQARAAYAARAGAPPDVGRLREWPEAPGEGRVPHSVGAEAALSLKSDLPPARHAGADAGTPGDAVGVAGG